MDVVVHNKKTFLLLSSASDASFDKYKADFATIKNGFKFK
jgi:hypothetical protein